jgi:hypothetical protein
MSLPLAYILRDLAYHSHTISELRRERVEGRIDKTDEGERERERGRA